MLNLLLEPLNFEFMRDALAVAILLGILCSLVGSYLIVQRQGLLGSNSHFGRRRIQISFTLIEK